MYRTTNPVKFTCGDINEAIDSIKSLIKDIEIWNNDKDSYPFDYLIEDIICELKPIENKLENLRQLNIKLRDWGEEKEKSLIECQKENEDLIDEIKNLRFNLEGSNELIIELKEELEKNDDN